MEHLFLAMTSFIQSYGGWGVLLASFFEEVIVPIPSTLVQSAAGLFILAGVPLSWAGVWKLIIAVALPSAIGGMLGSLVIYALVYYGGMAAARRFGKYFFMSEEKILKARRAIEERKTLWIALTALRIIPILPSVLIAAGSGLLRVPLWLYASTTVLGFFLRALYLGGAGWFASGSYSATSPGRRTT